MRKQPSIVLARNFWEPSTRAANKTWLEQVMSDRLPNDWTDKDQNDLDRGRTSWDDDQWDDYFYPSRPFVGTRLAHGFNALNGDVYSDCEIEGL
jgi:hypothetical protein